MAGLRGVDLNTGNTGLRHLFDSLHARCTMVSHADVDAAALGRRGRASCVCALVHMCVPSLKILYVRGPLA